MIGALLLPWPPTSGRPDALPLLVVLAVLVVVLASHRGGRE